MIAKVQVEVIEVLEDPKERRRFEDEGCDLFFYIAGVFEVLLEQHVFCETHAAEGEEGVVAEEAPDHATRGFALGDVLDNVGGQCRSSLFITLCSLCNTVNRTEPPHVTLLPGSAIICVRAPPLERSLPEAAPHRPTSHIHSCLSGSL